MEGDKSAHGKARLFDYKYGAKYFLLIEKVSEQACWSHLMLSSTPDIAFVLKNLVTLPCGTHDQNQLILTEGSFKK